MKLLNTTTIELIEVVLPHVPPYAILSHTWYHDEVGYEEMLSPTPATHSKKGYDKILRACHQARQDSYSMIWIDTCCIAKSSSSELSEAINSMFGWYSDAAKCYVHLSDLTPSAPAREVMGQCRWFTRGWTLQELLAPRDLDFYDAAWTFRGSKLQFLDLLLERTKIPPSVLTGNEKLQDCSVAIRMSWAKDRQTTRAEDMAYCLLGIFDVNMPMLYGEGTKAFRRLQEEIIKRSSDVTIFAWDHTSSTPSTPSTMDLLAPSPTAFSGYYDTAPLNSGTFDFSLTNKGLFVSGELILDVVSMESLSASGPVCAYILDLSNTQDRDGNHGGGICLRKIGPRLFCRDRRFPLGGFGLSKARVQYDIPVTNCYIIADASHTVLDTARNYRIGGIYIAHDDRWKLDYVAPENLWDRQDRVFLNPMPSGRRRDETVFIMTFSCKLGARTVPLIVLCHYHHLAHNARICQYDHHSRDIMFHLLRHGEDGIFWEDLELRFPALGKASPKVKVLVDGLTYEVAVTIGHTLRPHEKGEYQVREMRLITRELQSSRTRRIFDRRSARS